MVKDEAFEWIGGHMALDFTNTVTRRRSGFDRERLQSYDDLLKWSGQAGTLSRSAMVALGRAARDRPDIAAATYRDALRTRAELHSLFVTQATGHRTPGPVIASLNRRTRRAMSHLTLHSSAHHVTVQWDAAIRLARPLWPVLKATLELLTSSDLRRMRVCANPECGWVFLDQSRQRNRRWCSMRECGSRAKARAYYHRRHANSVRTAEHLDR